MNALIIIGTVIFVLYLIFRLVFVRNEPIVQDAEISFKSKQINSNPNNAELYCKRGFKLLQRGGNYMINGDSENANLSYQNAMNDFEKAIELDPQMGEAYCYKGMIQWARNDNVNARFTLLKSEELGYKRATEIMIDYGMR